MTAEYKAHGDVAVITMNNPPVNGLGYATRIGLTDGLEKANGDASVKAIVITGAGKAFSGGADIKEFGSPKAVAEPNLRADPAADGRQRVLLFYLLRRLRELPVLYQLHESRDVYLHGAAGAALRVLALQAAGGLGKRQLPGEAVRDLLEIPDPGARRPAPALSGAGSWALSSARRPW